MELLRNVLRVIKEQPDITHDIIDSFSNNQFLSKNTLFDSLDSNGLINKDSVVLILGCWYGSILIEYLAPLVKKIIAIDIDKDTINVGKKFFEHYNNVEWHAVDVFGEHDKQFYSDVNLIINTSCEHMKPMKDWDKWIKVKKDELYFAFQSNNMVDIEGHINCVINMDQFKQQLPKAFWIDEKEISDSRGTRFMLIGQLNVNEQFT